MKPTIFISSVKSEINLPKRNLEAIANNSKSKNDIASGEFKPSGYENVSWRYFNALGVGRVWVTLLNRQSNKVVQREIPVSASFIAVCTRSGGGKYQLQFSISLS